MGVVAFINPEWKKILDGSMLEAGIEMGFSKKRFFITLGISVVIWLVSGVIQLLVQQDQTFGFFSFGGSCEITGYPIALCISSHNNGKFILISLINVILWFWVIHLFWKWFDRRRMPSGK